LFPTHQSHPSFPLKIQKLTRVEIDECQLKGIFYNYDEKYFPGVIASFDTTYSHDNSLASVTSLFLLVGEKSPFSSLKISLKIPFF
jgi:hypothetical protein